jgi:hypothetical protein
MARVRIKILIFLLAVGVSAGCIGLSAWYYARVLRPEMRIKEEVRAGPPPDVPVVEPGSRRFDAAVEELRAGRLDQGRDALYQLLRQFPESPSCVEAKRIITQINLDRLFSTTDLEGKVDHIIQPGSNLNSIVSKHGTTLDMLARMNTLKGNMIHAGQHLLVVPLDFSFVVSLGRRTVTLLRQDRFFAEFAALEVKMPPGFRTPVELKIGGKSASLDGATLVATDPHYMEADKWIPTTRPGVVLRAAKERHLTGGELEEGETEEPGIYLRREDLEEVFALARGGSLIRIVD